MEETFFEKLKRLGLVDETIEDMVDEIDSLRSRLTTKKDAVAKLHCSDGLSAVQSAVNQKLCDAREHYDGMQRSVDRHKNNNCDKGSLMNTYQDAIKALNEAHADVERWMKAQAFVRDKLPKLIEGR
jgi:hypothetical protein